MAKIEKAKAVALFTALGITTAAKWNAKRMAAKLNKVDEMVDDDTNIEDADTQATLATCLEAIENGEELEIAEKAPAKDKPADKPADKPKGKGKGKPTEDAPAEEPKTPKASKAPKAAEEPKTPGVREVKTRPYLAGVVIKNAGVEAGITPAMVEELDELYGKQNPGESLFALRNAWHAIRGFNSK